MWIWKISVPKKARKLTPIEMHTKIGLLSWLLHGGKELNTEKSETYKKLSGALELTGRYSCRPESTNTHITEVAKMIFEGIFWQVSLSNARGNEPCYSDPVMILIF